MDVLNPRNRAQARHYCYRCGTPWPASEAICPSCGGTDRAENAARPRIEVEGDVSRFAGPWRMVPWPRQGSVAIFGGPGSGKSTLAALVNPKVWITKEQEPKPVGSMWRRVMSDTPQPPVHAVNDAQEVGEILALHTEGPIVLDSLTAFGLRDALIIAHFLVNWCQEHDERVLAILQVTKTGDSAGYMEIPHLFDAIINLSPDPWGVRAFRVIKSRWCALESVYWSFDADGRVSQPEFPAAYSVEGKPGEYWLHPYPLKGAKWSGILDALQADGKLTPGVACSAVIAPYMPAGFMVPMDHYERRRFAEHNGLAWIEAEEALALLGDDDTEEDPENTPTPPKED
jgi:hypothetical protein